MAEKTPGDGDPAIERMIRDLQKELDEALDTFERTNEAIAASLRGGQRQSQALADKMRKVYEDFKNEFVAAEPAIRRMTPADRKQALGTFVERTRKFKAAYAHLDSLLVGSKAAGGKKNTPQRELTKFWKEEDERRLNKK